MKAYHSIEELTKDLGVSVRTGWRWLQARRIGREKRENGETVFLLTGDTDNADSVTSDMSVGDKGERSRDSHQGGRERARLRSTTGTFSRGINKNDVTLNLIESLFALRSWVRDQASIQLQLANFSCTLPGWTDRDEQIRSSWEKHWKLIEHWYEEIQDLSIANKKEKLRTLFNYFLEVRDFIQKYGLGWVPNPDDPYVDPEDRSACIEDREKRKEEVSSLFKAIFQNLRSLIAED